MWSYVFEQLKSHRERSQVVLQLNPRVLDLPLPIQRFDDPFFPFGKAIVNATKAHVGMYLFDLASYMAMGAVGIMALERTIRYVGNEVPTILHGAFSDSAFGIAVDKLSFGVDFITVTQEALVQEMLGAFPYGAIWWNASHPIPEGGIWEVNKHLLTFTHNNTTLTFKVADKSTITRGRGDDFGEVIQAEVLKLV